MNHYESILAVFDVSSDQQPAFSRALALQKKDTKITVFLCIYDFSYDMTSMLKENERDAMKKAITKQKTKWIKEIIKKQNVDLENIEINVDWHKRSYEAIIKEVLAKNYDLVIKATSEHDKLKSVIFTPTDWHLIRKCPAPLLLVKSHSLDLGGNFLGAVNLSSESKAHLSLNSKLSLEGKKLANLLKGNLHFVNAYPRTPMNIAIEIPNFDPQSYNESIKSYHKIEMKKHCKKFNVPDENTHVLEGIPEDIIPKLAKDLKTEVVILGSIGRSGISAALIGNTAEHIIDRLDCDLLAIKPDDFVCPIK